MWGIVRGGKDPGMNLREQTLGVWDRGRLDFTHQPLREMSRNSATSIDVRCGN